MSLEDSSLQGSAINNRRLGPECGHRLVAIHLAGVTYDEEEMRSQVIVPTPDVSYSLILFLFPAELLHLPGSRLGLQVPLVGARLSLASNSVNSVTLVRTSSSWNLERRYLGNSS
jgi:hypothetical protein